MQIPEDELHCCCRLASSKRSNTTEFEPFKKKIKEDARRIYMFKCYLFDL